MADGFTQTDDATLATEADDAWAQEQLSELRELAGIGMTLARALPAGIEAAAGDPAAIGQLALTFSRVSRAIRQTHALEARLRQALKDGRCAIQAERKAWAETQRAEAVARRKAALRRAAYQAVESHHEVFEHDGSILSVNDCIENLADEPDSFLDQPLSTLLRRICDDLGLTADWLIFRHEPWAIAELRDRPPGSEYVGFHDDCLGEGTWPDDSPDLDPPGDGAPEP